MPDPISLEIATMAGEAARTATKAHTLAGEALAIARSAAAALRNTGALLANVVRPTLANLNAAEREHVRAQARHEAGQQALLEVLADLAELVQGPGAGEAVRARVLEARRLADEACLAELLALEQQASAMPTPDLVAGKLGTPAN